MFHTTRQGVVRIGQQEVYDFLTQHKGKWFTSRDISEQLNVSIGSVTMSLKKLRKTNLIKYRNTGVRNTFIYTVEPEGVTVAPPPGIEEPEASPEEKPRQAAKTEKIIPKVVERRERVPLVVPRSRTVSVEGAKKPSAKPKKGTKPVTKIVKPPKKPAATKRKAATKKRVTAAKTVKRTSAKAAKSAAKSKKRPIKKRPATRVNRSARPSKKRTSKKASKKPAVRKRPVKVAKQKKATRSQRTKSGVKPAKKSAKRPVKTKPAKSPKPKGFIDRLFSR